KELAEARNQASTLVYQTEKSLKELGDKIDEGSKSAIEAAMKKVKDAEAGDDVAAIKSAIEELNTATHALSEHLYKAAQDAGGGAEGATEGDSSDEGNSSDDVIDAEFETKQ